MCGLVAVASPSGGASTLALGPALASMAARGPDGEGMWADAQGHCALGHVRLAVVDRSGSPQPLGWGIGSDRTVAVVHGEFYDYQATRKRLQAAGHRFATGGDAEILLGLYREYGLDCVHHLRGEWAFALWDAGHRRLVCARDRFGCKPLRWARLGKAVAVATQGRALFALGVPAGWDEQSWRHVLCHQYLPPSRSWFAGVHTVEPGHILVTDGQDIQIRRWGDLDLPPADYRMRAASAAERGQNVDRLADALHDVVRLRVQADDPVATTLSGGLDSATVTALVAQQIPDLQAFHLSFVGEGYAETALARAAARASRSTLRVVPAPEATLVAHIGTAARAAETMGINGQLPAKWLLAKAINAAGRRAVLTGEGADELFWGYSHLLADAGHWVGTDATQAGVMLPTADAVPGIAAVDRALGWTPTFLAAKWHMLEPLRTLFAPVDADATFSGLFAGLALQDQVMGRARPDQSAWLWSRLALAGYILTGLGDGTEMAHAVEGRLPLLDDAVLEVARALPAEQLLCRFGGKGALREAARRCLPRRLCTTPKHPLLSPPMWVQPDARADGEVVTLLRSSSVAALPGADGPALRALADRWRGLDASQRRRWDPCICLLASAAGLSTLLIRPGGA